jgi:hypothetical protein
MKYHTFKTFIKLEPRMSLNVFKKVLILLLKFLAEKFGELKICNNISFLT